jgi:hypothetical protein
MTEYEHDRIWMAEHRASHAEEYFRERPFFNDQTYLRVFDAAFQLGWEAHRDVSTSKLEGEQP